MGWRTDRGGTRAGDLPKQFKNHLIFLSQIQEGNGCFLLYIMLKCSFVDLFRSEFSSNLMKVSRVEVTSGGRLPARAERIQKFVDTEEKEGSKIAIFEIFDFWRNFFERVNRRSSLR